MTIFETDEAFIHHAETDCRTVVVTFSHLDFPLKGVSFWGATPLEKLGYSAIGVVAKRDVWYAPTLMDPTLTIVLELLKRYHIVVLYGFSMGAYAALKYSRKLGADVVIALSPQASVDVAENQFIDPKFYNEDFHQSMGVRVGDVAGDAYLIFDPYMKADNWSAYFIKDAYPELHLIPAPRAEHETIDIISRTEALEGLLQTCLRGDPSQVSRLIHLFRKSSWRVMRARNTYLERRRSRIVPEALHLED